MVIVVGTLVCIQGIIVIDREALYISNRLGRLSTEEFYFERVQ